MIVDGQPHVAIHTHRGVQLYQFLAGEQIGLSWSRELRQPSKCELQVPALYAEELPAIQPWVQWITVWDGRGREVLWRGPITRRARRRDSLTITAFDIGAYLRRTRCPLTKRWDATDPADIAREMWAAMIEDKNLNVRPFVQPDPLGDRFDFATVKDDTMLDQVIGDLVQMGLRWTVVGGVPYLGPMPLRPVAALGEHDFIGGGLELVTDGESTFNDVVLRAADTISRGRVDIAGQNLQTIVNVDNMFGVSNADKAVRQYVRHTGSIRDVVVVPSGAELHPDAPVSVDQLIPSARFTVQGYGLLTLQELQSMKVTCAPGSTSVAVSLESVNDDLPELVAIVGAGAGAGVGL